MMLVTANKLRVSCFNMRFITLGRAWQNVLHVTALLEPCCLSQGIPCSIAARLNASLSCAHWNKANCLNISLTEGIRAAEKRGDSFHAQHIAG
jgi:hypothetical protein